MVIDLSFKYEYVIDRMLSRVQVVDYKITPSFITNNSKDYEILFTNSKYSNGKELIYDQIFKLKSGLILYLCRESNTTNFLLNVYYTSEQTNEINILLSAIKQWKE
jgi:hypothetical protein